MARERKIFIGRRGEQRMEILAHIRQQFNVTDDVALKFMDYLSSTPLDAEDVESITTQMGSADSRPPLQVALTHHEHTIEALLDRQAEFTDGEDSADYPNPAIRHRGHSELLLRRMTLGGILRLQAAHEYAVVLGNEDRPSSTLPQYEAGMWRRIVAILSAQAAYPEDDDLFGKLSRMSAKSAASYALYAYMASPTEPARLAVIRRMLGDCGTAVEEMNFWTHRTSTVLALFDDAPDSVLYRLANDAILRAVDNHEEHLLAHQCNIKMRRHGTVAVFNMFSHLDARAARDRVDPCDYIQFIPRKPIQEEVDHGLHETVIHAEIGDSQGGLVGEQEPQVGTPPVADGSAV
ncbi:hypothetical protein RCMENCHIE_20 [Rhodobacter phage RcMenchie]|nr:hypothetical protein RCMENCHIE_20 [Rhodobacter phage RcMenchie]